MGTTAIVAEPDVLAWYEMISPATTEKTPINAATAIIAGTRLTSSAAVAGGPTSNPKNQQRSNGLERANDRQHDQHKEQHVGRLRVESVESGLLFVEGEHEKAPVEHHRGSNGDDRNCGQHDKVRLGHAEHVAEEDRREASAVRRRLRNENHAKAEHADEQQPNAGVLREGCLAVDEVDAPDHHQCSNRRPEQGIEADQDGEGDARDHAVDECVSEERHPPDHHPGANDGRRDGGEGPGQQRPLLKRQFEWSRQPVHETNTVPREGVPIVMGPRVLPRSGEHSW